MANPGTAGTVREKHSRIVYFRIIVFLFPLLLLLLLEVSLRVFDYGADLALFVPTAPSFADREYLIINPRIGARYFPEGYWIPRPTSDAFLREKPENGYRIFALGGSTTAGWPYPNNVMFTRGLEQKLVEIFPDKQIEVVNLGIAAINSFTLLDFIDEVLDQRPDAILIYAGHNEFYGALGAASTVSLGRNSWVRLYLWLQRFKVFVLLRDAINRALRLIREDGPAPDPRARFPTLMGQVIGEEQIPLGSDTYERGKAQFKGNMDVLLAKTKAAGVPVIVSELVSNVRGHPPFFSNRDIAPLPAEKAFRNARRLEAEGRFEAACAEYYKAKDLDGLRFRAPEEFNPILHELAEKHGVPLVPMKTYFETASPNGLIGNELMLEHLHPNARGYQLMGQAFFDAMHEHGLLSDAGRAKGKNAEKFTGFSELDVAIGKMRILRLTDHWPFRPETESNSTVERYAPETKAEEIARDFVLNKFGFAEAHVRMAEHYARQGRGEAALGEFWALINSRPLDVVNYLGAAQVLIRTGAPERAWPFLEASLKVRSTGADTERLLMELTDAYLLRDQRAKARRVLARLQAVAPRHPAIESLAAKLQ